MRHNVITATEVIGTIFEERIPGFNKKTFQDDYIELWLNRTAR
jgi:hypothetical protein